LTARARDPDRWASFRQALVLARLLRTARPDHLHAHLRRGGDVARLTDALTRCGYSFTAHARDIYVRNADLPAKLAAASFVVTVCEYNRALLARIEPRCSERIRVLHPFLGRDLFLSAPAAPARATQGQPLRFVTICRLVPKKGVAVLLDALHLSAHSGQQLHLTIAGDGCERGRLEQQIQALDLGAQVTLAGAVDAAGVRRLLMEADCFVLASLVAPDGDSDATPTVLGEAMALGVPVVSTRVAGIPEIVPKGAGLLVKPADPRALADAIATIASLSPAERRAMGQRGRAFVESYWNGARDAPKLVAWFQQAASERLNAAKSRPNTR
jgi:glycosyltransferase involved in cell wall biosynthesis